jgi:predicted SnoaL-like aldol condensation-catalyzing enzyme
MIVPIKHFLVSLLLPVFSAMAIPHTIARKHSFCPGHNVSEHKQRKLFHAFVDEFYYEKDVKGAYNVYVGENLIEHSPTILDGRAAGIAALTPIIAAATFDLIHVLFDCGIGSVHSKVTLPGGQPFLATADYFRYDGSCIVEHWDVSQSVPPNATSPHPLF